MVSFIILGIIILIILMIIKIFNNLVGFKNQAENAWHQIDVQLKRRIDLIPNLVETVKAYTKHEEQTFLQITEARTDLMRGGSIIERARAQNELDGALRSLFVIAEAYPDLKANENFLFIQDELTVTEDNISISRETYNNTVLKYNQVIQQVPGNLVAGMFGFVQKEFFAIDEVPRKVPEAKY